MTPTFVHRYAFSIREAIEALLGDAIGDCEAWRVRVEGEEVVIDVVAPAPGIAPTVGDMVSGQKPGEGAAQGTPADEQSGETSPEPELKGGPLARRAAIACGERGFWTFLEVDSADEAKAEVCRRCGVESRKLLDHDAIAAQKWEEIDRRYRLWLEGYD